MLDYTFNESVPVLDHHPAWSIQRSQRKVERAVRPLFPAAMRVHASIFSLALDSGRPISLDELCHVADAYWTEWSARAPKSEP